MGDGDGGVIVWCWVLIVVGWYLDFIFIGGGCAELAVMMQIVVDDSSGGGGNNSIDNGNDVFTSMVAKTCEICTM